MSKKGEQDSHVSNRCTLFLRRDFAGLQLIVRSLTDCQSMSGAPRPTKAEDFPGIRGPMIKTHPLNLNLRKVILCLTGVLSPAELEKIKAEIHRNVRQALQLSGVHLRAARAARTQRPGNWRQMVSRAYYCCYCASRALRLAETGTFSTEVEDHKKVGDLPDSFPSRARWADILTKFRADRNLADYDHSAHSGDLEYTAEQYLTHAESLLAEIKLYLRSQGVI